MRFLPEIVVYLGNGTNRPMVSYDGSLTGNHRYAIDPRLSVLMAFVTLKTELGPYMYARTVCPRTTKFGTVIYAGSGVFLGSATPITNGPHCLPNFEVFGTLRMV